jgi:hypothetical protein
MKNRNYGERDQNGMVEETDKENVWAKKDLKEVSEV